MNPIWAHAIRRGALAAAVLVATLAAHAASGAGMHVTPLAPAAWMGIVAVAVMAGSHRRGTAFTAWGPVRLTATLLIGQMASHLVLHSAPWAFGFVGHGHMPIWSFAAVASHGVAAVLLAAVLCRGQSVLVRAVAAVKRLIVGVQSGRARPAGRVVACVAAPHPGTPRVPRTSRGPPGPMSAA